MPNEPLDLPVASDPAAFRRWVDDLHRNIEALAQRARGGPAAGVLLTPEDLEQLGMALAHCKDSVAAARMLSILEDRGWSTCAQGADEAKAAVLGALVRSADLTASDLRWFCEAFPDDHEVLLPALVRVAIRERDFDFVLSELAQQVDWRKVAQPDAREFLDALGNRVRQAAASGPGPWFAGAEAGMLVGWLRVLTPVAYPDKVERMEWFCGTFCDLGDGWFPSDEREHLTATFRGWLPGPKSAAAPGAVAALQRSSWRDLLEEETIDEWLSESRRAHGLADGDEGEE
ncbi:MAG: hypothetical protein ACOZNI_30680 [Myxococcota bacterium]